MAAGPAPHGDAGPAVESGLPAAPAAAAAAVTLGRLFSAIIGPQLLEFSDGLLLFRCDLHALPRAESRSSGSCPLSEGVLTLLHVEKAQQMPAGKLCRRETFLQTDQGVM
jgi:hypothetical protein